MCLIHLLIPRTSGISRVSVLHLHLVSCWESCSCESLDEQRTRTRLESPPELLLLECSPIKKKTSLYLHSSLPREHLTDVVI